MRWLLIWVLTALPALAQEDKTGQFDYYVMALSWSPNWCEIEGEAKGSDQYDARHDHVLDFAWSLATISSWFSILLSDVGTRTVPWSN